MQQEFLWLTGSAKAITKRAATVQIKNKNDFNGTAQIEVKWSWCQAQMAVWSDDNGQDDLKWYSVSETVGQ